MSLLLIPEVRACLIYILGQRSEYQHRCNRYLRKKVIAENLINVQDIKNMKAVIILNQ